MTKPYVLSKSAVADLEDIIRYTNEHWGVSQCLSYIEELETAATALARGKIPFKDLRAIHPNLRMAKSGKHFIFCIQREAELPLILAILHERMDILARLKKRLA